MSTLKIEHISHLDNGTPDLSIDSSGHLNIVNGNLQMGGVTMLDASTGSLNATGIVTAVGGNTNNTDDAAVFKGTGTEHIKLLLDTSSTGGHRASVALESNSNEVNIATTGSDEMRFSTANTGDALFIKSDGNVGIGTASPTRKLDVRGAVRFSVNTSTHETFVFTTQAANDAKQIMKNASSTDTIVLNTGGNSWLNGGNVGIGTTSPQAKLHVYNENGGNATDKATMLSEAVLKLQPHTTNSTNLLVAQVNGGNGIGLQVTNGPATANWDIALSPFGGNVGIGNTSPGDYYAGAANLVIGSNNGTDNGITIVTPANKIGRIHFADGTTGSDEYAGFIAYKHSTDEFLFGAGADGGTDLTIKSGIVYAHQFNRGTPASSAPFGTIIFHDNQMSAANKSISNTQTSWSDGATKVVTPQSANSYFWVELYHNEHINTTTPNYGGGLRLIGDTGGVSTEIARGGEMIYVTNSAYSSSYNGNAKVWGGWYSPATASNITFRLQVTGTSSQSGNNYYWHWQSNYIANQPGPRLRIIEFT